MNFPLGLKAPKMAESLIDTENPLNCPICLNLLKDPVTTSCGHSFCMDCIKSCWDQEVHRGVYSCPTCRTTFNQRPALSRSTVLAGILEGTKREDPAGPGDVACDVCKGRKSSAQAAVENSDRIFTEIIRSIQNMQANVSEKIRAQENKEVQDAENHIQMLEQEIVKLQKENCKVEPLLHTEDHVYFFQNYASCSTLNQRTANDPRKMNDILTFENVEKSVSHLKRQLDKLCEDHMGRISKTVADVQIFKNSFQSNKICHLLLEEMESDEVSVSDSDWESDSE